MTAAVLAQRLRELFVARTILPVDRLPPLGTGNTDYVAVHGLALETIAAPQG